MADQASAPHLQVEETHRAARSRDDGPYRLRMISFLQGMGLAALMLIGVAATGSPKATHTTPTSFLSSEWKRSQSNARASGLIPMAGQASFFSAGGLPVLARSEAGHGQNLALRPAIEPSQGSTGQRSVVLDRVRTIDSSFRVPGLHMTASGDNDITRDDDFQTALSNFRNCGGDTQTVLSRFSPIDELPTVRDAYRDLERQMNVAVKLDDFSSAIRYRNEMQDLRCKDPATYAKEARQAMWEAAKANNFAVAAKYKDQLKTLREYLPEYKLAGKWLGRVRNWDERYMDAIPEQGRINVDLVYKNDSLIAVQLGSKDGELPSGAWAWLFEADVSEPKMNSQGTIVPDGKIYAEHFEGKGNIQGDAIPGKLYLMDDGGLGFSFEDRAGGDGNDRRWRGDISSIRNSILPLAHRNYDPLGELSAEDRTRDDAANEGSEGKLFVVFERSEANTESPAADSPAVMVMTPVVYTKKSAPPAVAGAKDSNRDSAANEEAKARKAKEVSVLSSSKGASKTLLHS